MTLTLNWVVFGFTVTAILGAVIYYCSYRFTKGPDNGDRQD